MSCACGAGVWWAQSVHSWKTQTPSAAQHWVSNTHRDVQGLQAQHSTATQGGAQAVSGSMCGRMHVCSTPVGSWGLRASQIAACWLHAVQVRAL